jgi:hypothetical protein
MNGTAGEASWRISGQAQTARISGHQAAGRETRIRIGAESRGRLRRVARYAVATAK